MILCQMKNKYKEINKKIEKNWNFYFLFNFNLLNFMKKLIRNIIFISKTFINYITYYINIILHIHIAIINI